MKTRGLILGAAIAALVAVSGRVSAQYAAPSPYALMPVRGAYATGPVAPAHAAAPAVLATQAPKPMPTDSISAQSSNNDCSSIGACGEACGAACGSACGDCGCGCGWSHCVAVFGEFLYLRPRDADVAYAVEMNGPVASPPNTPIQVSPIAVVDHGYDPGFRAGFSFVCCDFASVTASYTMFEANSVDQIAQNPVNVGTVIRSMVSHPSTYQVAFDDLAAQAEQDISFDLIDLDYRELFASGADYKLVYLAGARYAMLEQVFQSTFGFNGTRTVATDIDFEGIGLRLGLEGERYSRSGRFMVYGKGVANVLAGKFNGTYAQGQSFDASEVNTGWEAGRITPVLEIEVGAGWTSPCGTWRLLGGYVFTAWTNVVKTDEFIQAVQRNDFADIGDDLTFDGLVARFEGRF